MAVKQIATLEPLGIAYELRPAPVGGFLIEEDGIPLEAALTLAAAREVAIARAREHISQAYRIRPENANPTLLWKTYPYETKP